MQRWDIAGLERQILLVILQRKNDISSQVGYTCPNLGRASGQPELKQMGRDLASRKTDEPRLTEIIHCDSIV